MKSKLLFLALFLFATSQLFAAKYFIATDGSDTNAGTIESPFASYDKAYGLVEPGDTIYVRGGIYPVSKWWEMAKTGTVDKYYKLWAYPEDLIAGNRPILDGGNNGMRITQEGKYWYVKGFTIRNASDNGMRVFGSHNIIENCVFHDCSDSGFVIQQSNGTMPNDGSIAAYNLVLNCDSYHNIKQTDDADGFCCKLSPGAGNVFRGCRAWNNADDGWDFYYSRFQVIVEDCWTFSNGRDGGNGNGFKSNGSASSSSTARTQAPHVYSRCIAFDHKYKAGSNNKGFDQNHNEGNVTMINCLSFDNEKNFAYQEDCKPTATNGTITGTKHVFRNCVGFEPYSEKYARTLLPGEVLGLGKEEVSYRASNTWFASTIDDQYNSWNLFPETIEGVASRADYVTLERDDALAARQVDGSLPNNGFGRLKSTSKLIDKGVPYTYTLVLNTNDYPTNIQNPSYITSTTVTSLDGMPDLGPYEFIKEVNPDNVIPVITLTEPTVLSYEAGEAILFSATATDTDGTVSRVEFYAGNQIVGMALTAPYTYTWNAAPEGDYVLSAIAYDNEGGIGYSNTLLIEVKNAGGEGGTIGDEETLLKLTSYKSGLSDEILSIPWSSLNSVGQGSKRGSADGGSSIKLNFSSSKGGTIISPAIDMNEYLIQNLKLNFCSSGGGNRNLKVLLSFDGGNKYTSAYTQSGGSNGATISVDFPIADKIPAGATSFVLKLEAANAVEVWNIEVLGAKKNVTGMYSPEKSLSIIQGFPSVTDGFTALVFELENATPIQLAVYDMNGRKVQDLANNNWYPAGYNSVLCDMSALPRGMYICILKYGDFATYTKIIKK